MASKVLVLIGCALCCIAYIYYNSGTPQVKQPTIALNLDREKLMNSTRKISFENHMNTKVTLSLALKLNDKDIVDEQQHILEAGEAGWVPYFSAGTLQVTANTTTIPLDITQESKEYKIIIADNGTIATEMLDLTD